MKHQNPDLHLNHDELLRALIDPSDLDATQQAHFKGCQHCRRQTQDLSRVYSRLGRMARQMAPKPRRAFRVPSENVTAGRRYFRPGLALGISAALIFIFTIGEPEFTQISQTPPPGVVQNLENEDHLMEEIDTLVEDALPAEYQQVAALLDDRSIEDLDELIDWVVPFPKETDDLEQPVNSDRERWPESLARSDRVDHAERRMV